jgi:hypothetical protein
VSPAAVADAHEARPRMDDALYMFSLAAGARGIDGALVVYRLPGAHPQDDSCSQLREPAARRYHRHPGIAYTIGTAHPVSGGCCPGLRTNAEEHGHERSFASRAEDEERDAEKTSPGFARRAACTDAVHGVQREPPRRHREPGRRTGNATAEDPSLLADDSPPDPSVVGLQGLSRHSQLRQREMDEQTTLSGPSGSARPPNVYGRGA